MIIFNTMGFFDKLFGKKVSKEQQNIQLNKDDIITSFDEDLTFKIIRHSSTNLKEKIRASTLDVMTTQLYMHYWADDFANDDPNDQYYQNLVVYFWKAGKHFFNKSLTPVFETYTARNFVFIVNNKNIIIKNEEASPWSGMSGIGDKYFCEIFGEKISVPDLEKIGLVEYVESVEVTNENIGILTDNEQYFYLADDRTSFKNNGFYIQNKLVPIDIAYEIGAITVVKKVTNPD